MPGPGQQQPGELPLGVWYVLFTHKMYF
jgi:hypothetical protein